MDYTDTEVRLTENMKRILAPHVLCGWKRKLQLRFQLISQISFTSQLPRSIQTIILIVIYTSLNKIRICCSSIYTYVFVRNSRLYPLSFIHWNWKRSAKAEDTTEEKRKRVVIHLFIHKAKPSFSLPAQLIGIKTCQIRFLEFRGRHFQDVHIVIYLEM